MPSRKTVLSLAVLLLASVPLALAQGTYTQIDVPGAVYTVGEGIDAAGDIVGWYEDANFNLDGFLLSGGTYNTINPPGSTFTQLFGINDMGQIVGQANAGCGGCLYDIATQTFTTISYPKANRTLPFAINNTGTIAGQVVYGSNEIHGFELVGSTYRQISPPRTFLSLVTGITASGTLYGQGVGKIPNLTFAFSQGKYSLRVIPNAPGAVVNGVNPAGAALVGTYNPSSGVTAGFLYQTGTLTTLQFPGSSFTEAFGINAAGEVVGLFVDAESNEHGFTWTPPADAAKKYFAFLSTILLPL
jgi:probable HAF family extracellular repeat protein